MPNLPIPPHRGWGFANNLMKFKRDRVLKLVIASSKRIFRALGECIPVCERALGWIHTEAVALITLGDTIYLCFLQQTPQAGV